MNYIWIANEAENNKCYVNNVFWKVFKNFGKLLRSRSPMMLQTFFIYSKSTKRALGQKGTQGHLNRKRALQGHSKSTRALKAFEGHSSTQGTWAFGHSPIWGTRALKYHLGTRALKSLGDLSTQALKEGLALRRLGTRGTRGTLISRLAFIFCVKFNFTVILFNNFCLSVIFYLEICLLEM